MDFSKFVLAAVVDDLQRVEQAGIADAVEFRMDRAHEPLSQLEAYSSKIPIIATNRRREEGGDAAGEERLHTLATATAQAAVGAVDIELASVQAGEADEVISSCEDSGTSLIVSWHEFEETPDETVLERQLRAACGRGTVGKAAVMAHDVSDVLTLLEVTHKLASEGLNVATMSMGNSGRHSRILAPLYGSRIGYAPIDSADKTAPGQYELHEMASLIDSLR